MQTQKITNTMDADDEIIIPEQIKSIFDFSSDAAIIVNLKREIRYCNLAFIDLSGLRSSEMIKNISNKKKCFEIICMKGFCNGSCLALESIKQKKNINYDLVESAFVSLPNENFMLKPSAIPLIEADGYIFGVLEIFKDFTAEENVQRKYQNLFKKERDYSKNLEREVEERTKELKGINIELVKSREELLNSVRLASIGEVAGATAHEILNPINNILIRIEKINKLIEVKDNHLEILKEITNGWQMDFAEGGIEKLTSSLTQFIDSDKKEMLVENDLTLLGKIHLKLINQQNKSRTDFEFISSETKRVVKIVDRMRSLARASREKKVISVDDLLHEAWTLSEDSLKKRNVNVLEKFSQDKLVVYADKSELIQVVSNLLKNAMQAIEGAHGRNGGVITLSAEKENDEIQIRIKDNGCGISKKDQAAIFEPGFTTKDVKDGTGIGLSLSRRLVRGVGGDIELESSNENGTTMLIRLPLHRVAE